MSDWVAILALVLAIFAIIIIIILFFLLFRANDTARAVVDQWTTQTGLVAATDTFVGGPNSMYIVPVLTAPLTLTVSAYVGIDIGVNTNTTTLFLVNNIKSTQIVTVKSPAGSTFSIPAGQSITYRWISITDFAQSS